MVDTIGSSAPALGPVQRTLTDNPDMVRALLNRGADIEARENALGTTPLHWAAAGSPAALRVLLNRGANIWAQDAKGQFPLFWAAFSENPETIRLLREAIVN